MRAALASYQRLFLARTGQVVSDAKPDKASEEYGGGHMLLDGTPCYFRMGKITPTKVGQFVTFYERSTTSGKIVPLSFDEVSTENFIVFCVDGDNSGQFVFPPKALEEHKVLSSRRRKGKLAFRVYPPGVAAGNKTAEVAQRWQAPYFCSTAAPVNEIKSLFTAKETSLATVGAKRNRGVDE